MDSNAVALGMMCKAPIEGACKTRLCPPLTMAEAAEMSRRFIADVAMQIAEVVPAAGGHAVAIHTPSGAEAAFEGLLPDGFAMLAQRGHDLGERLLHAATDLLAGGCGGVCLINADSPTLPASLLRRTVEELRRPGERIVIGPAVDGGYYLIGLKHPYAALFDGIAWSTSQVLAQTLSRAASLRVPVTLLPLWYDIDDLGSLQLLAHELFGSGMPLAVDGIRGSPAPRSRLYLQALLQAPDACRLALAGGAGAG
ncbi:MAG TPA: TIGR04282 family arsenosugar biosynthesis glycosyltransferase [Rhodospirillales bacterium]|nr:TIGR04282 family arsenosugar biosynthesis glycosyltransferase [Rhodospirillales bacterium]